MKSELRKDMVSGDWILIAPSRGKRPNDFSRQEPRKKEPVKTCSLENDSKNWRIISSYPEKDIKHKNWRVMIIHNKYPAVYSVHDNDAGDLSKLSQTQRKGPYIIKSGFGHHDLIFTKNHDKDFSELSKKDALLVIEAFRDRYLRLIQHTNISYVSMFHNFGPRAGATMYHPHYQILAVSVVPPDVQHSLNGSSGYFRKNKKCVHCVMLKWEARQKDRVIFENESAIAFAPFVSKAPFEVRIFPKKHFPYFEDTPARELALITEALRQSIKKVKKSLDPDYNFFIHTAPIQNKKSYSHYHWHIEILPKLSNYAGFELATGIEINVVDPDEAAKFIRKNR